MYYVDRFTKEGNEIIRKTKQFDTFAKALTYGRKYASGTKFISYYILDDNFYSLYGESSDGQKFPISYRLQKLNLLDEQGNLIM